MIEISSENDKNIININFSPGTIEEDVIQNVKFILASTKEKNPLARDLGLDGIIDSKGVKNSGYERKVIEALEKYEPRFRVSKILIKYIGEASWSSTVRGDIVVN